MRGQQAEKQLVREDRVLDLRFPRRPGPERTALAPDLVPSADEVPLEPVRER
jgi:hypothetical protein